jgi:L-ascorbate metabolism protein UlaG (beta-lactamase superfamily)
MPSVEADVVLVTHEHFDHNAISRVAGSPQVIRGAGEVEGSDFVLSGIRDKHASPDDLDNTIYVLDVGDVRVCHLGDNRPDMPDEVVESIGRIDWLIVPVDDSSHLLRFWEVDWVISRVNPRVVVPVHYLIEGVHARASTLLPIDTWLSTQPGVRLVGTATLRMRRDDVPKQREVWVFDAAG